MNPLGIVASGRRASAPVSSYSSLIMGLGPAAYYRLGEASGTVMADASGNARDGTYNSARVTLGTPGLVAGNTAATFADVAGEGGSKPYAGWMDGARTVECLFKPSITNGSNGHTVLSQSDVGGTGSWHIEIYLNNLYLYVGGGYASGSVPVSAGTTYHVGFRYTGGVGSLLLNGTQVLSSTVALTSSSSFRVGSRGGTEPFGPFVGVIDEVSWCATGLTDAQVLSHAQAGGTA